MSNENKPKNLEGSKKIKMSELLTIASNSSLSSGLTTRSIVSPHLAPDGKDDDPQDAEGMKRSLRHRDPPFAFF